MWILALVPKLDQAKRLAEINKTLKNKNKINNPVSAFLCLFCYIWSLANNGFSCPCWKPTLSHLNFGTKKIWRNKLIQYRRSNNEELKRNVPVPRTRSTRNPLSKRRRSSPATVADAARASSTTRKRWRWNPGTITACASPASLAEGLSTTSWP